MLSPEVAQRVPSGLDLGQTALLLDCRMQHPLVAFGWWSVYESERSLDGLLDPEVDMARIGSCGSLHMMAAAEALPSSGPSIASRAAHPAHIQERTTMLETVGDDREPPVNAAVRLAGHAPITDASPMRSHYRPAQAAAILLWYSREVRRDGQRLRPIDGQFEQCRHLLEDRAAEQIWIAGSVGPINAACAEKTHRVPVEPLTRRAADVAGQALERERLECSHVAINSVGAAQRGCNTARRMHPSSHRHSDSLQTLVGGAFSG